MDALEYEIEIRSSSKLLCIRIGSVIVVSWSCGGVIPTAVSPRNV